MTCTWAAPWLEHFLAFPTPEKEQVPVLLK